MAENSEQLILNLLRDKSVLKQDVYHNTLSVFRQLKEAMSGVIEQLKLKFGDTDSRVELYYRDKGDFQSEIKVAGDVIIFQMHTNVFTFDRSHSLWRSAYLKDNERNSYVGIINIYNFLADSFKYQREADIGYLIARIFVNRENHFLVQGKRQLGYLFNDFINSTLGENELKSIVHSAILYTLDFDMYTPPYETLQEITVQELQSLSQSTALATGKRLGFRFGLDNPAL